MITPIKFYKLTATLCVLALSVPLIAEEASSYVSEVKTTSEIFTSKILKIYECQEDGGDYIAYVVDWRGHEVVVNDLAVFSASKRLAVGDTVRCRMSEMQTTISGVVKLKLNFMIVSDREVSTSDAEVVMKEVRERRLKRQESKSVEEKKQN